MEITTERLILKEISWDDLEDIHRLHSVPEVDEYNTLGIPADLEETRALIHKDIEAKIKDPQSSYTWRIMIKNSLVFIGLAGMNREGLRRKILPIRGEWKDNFHYAIVEDDPRDY